MEGRRDVAYMYLGVLFSPRGPKVCCLQCLRPKVWQTRELTISDRLSYQQISVGSIISVHHYNFVLLFALPIMIQGFGLGKVIVKMLCFLSN